MNLLLEQRWTPPLWWRHFMPWGVLGLISEHSGTCWAGMVMWKLGYDWSWWPTQTCFEGPADWVDYCGKFEEQPLPTSALGVCDYSESRKP